MHIVILFGLPGTGKTFVASVFQKYHGYHFFEGDAELPKKMRHIIDTQRQVNENMRDIFFSRLIRKIKQLQKKHRKLVVAQTFIKEKYRTEILHQLPKTIFVLVNTDTEIREKRLIRRINEPLDLTYARKMCLFFEKPAIPYSVINNNQDGEESIKLQILRLYALWVNK